MFPIPDISPHAKEGGVHRTVADFVEFRWRSGLSMPLVSCDIEMQPISISTVTTRGAESRDFLLWRNRSNCYNIVGVSSVSFLLRLYGWLL